MDGKGIEELADSIRRHGFLGTLEGRRKDGKVELAYGARRLEAARRAGLTAVPVILRDWDDDKMREVALVENLQREDLNPLEEARGLAELMEAHGYSQEQAARVLGKSQGYISQRLLLLRLSPEVQKALGNGEITATHARALAGIPAGHQPAVLTAISGLSTRKAQNLIEALSQALSNPEWWTLPEDVPYITRNLALLLLHRYRELAGDKLVPWLIALREEGILKPLPALARTLEREAWHARVLFRAGDTQKAWEDMVREEHPDWVCDNCHLRTRTHLVQYVGAYTASSAPRCGLRFPDGRTCPAYLGALPARIEVAVNHFLHIQEVPAEVSDLDELERFVAEELAAGESKQQDEMEKAAEEIRRRVEVYWAFRDVEHPAAQTCVRCLHHKVGAAGREACEFGNSPPANRWERPSFRLWVREDGLRVPRCSRFEYKSVEALPSLPVPGEVGGLLRTTAYYFLKRSAQSPSPLRVLVQQAGGIREFLHALPPRTAAALVLEEAMSDLIEGAWIRGETRVLPGADGDERWKEERLEE